MTRWIDIDCCVDCEMNENDFGNGIAVSGCVDRVGIYIIVDLMSLIAE